MSDHFFKTHGETKAWLDSMGVKRYTIHDDLTVDVDSRVDIAGRCLTHIPVRFGLVSGHFFCNDNQLTRLDGAPVQCRAFDCSRNQLTSLVRSPVTCGRLICNGNDLTSLDGMSKNCGGIECHDNPSLSDISAIPECCEIYFDRDSVARNKSAIEIALLEKNNSAQALPSAKPGRIL